MLTGSLVNGLLVKIAVKSKAWSDLSSVLKHGAVGWLFQNGREANFTLNTFVSKKVAVSNIVLEDCQAQ